MSLTPKEKAAAATPAALSNRQMDSSASRSKHQAHLNKSTLMSPLPMLDMLSIRYQRAGARLAVFCPFHKDGKERNPSLSMNPKDGYYRCFTCGEKGHDVIAFYRAVTGAGFMETLKALGVYHD